MKKSISYIFIGCLLASFSACNSVYHKHLPSEWQYNETVHWQTIHCTLGKCDIDPGLYEHFDNDGDGVCDECGYERAK